MPDLRWQSELSEQYWCHPTLRICDVEHTGIVWKLMTYGEPGVSVVQTRRLAERMGMGSLEIVEHTWSGCARALCICIPLLTPHLRQVAPACLIGPKDAPPLPACGSSTTLLGCRPVGQSRWTFRGRGCDHPDHSKRNSV